MVETINSLQNKFVKNAAKLSERKYRQQSGMFVLEGIKLVQELLDSNWQIETVFVEQNLPLTAEFKTQLLEKSANMYYVTKGIIDKISDVPSAQGIIAVAHIFSQPIPAFTQHSSILVLENIQDPGNIGTIIRTAVATGSDAIIVTPDCADIYSPKVVRSSMGGILRIPILTMEIAAALDFVKKNEFQIYTTSLKDADNLYTKQLTEKTAIVLGNEASGVSAYAFSQSTNKIFIPQIGKIESLNVSIAAGVIMYEIVRQKLSCGVYST